MSKSRIRPDRGLVTRMVATMFLLGLVYVIFIVALSYSGFPWYLVLLIAVGLFLAQYYFSDRIALYAMHAREVSPAEAPELHAIVDRLVALTDVPKPRVAIADSDIPNAFATGRNARNSVVCVTTGLLRRLEPAELEGVLSHEMAHVAHRDVAVMTVASVLGVLAGFLTRMVLYTRMPIGRGRDSNNTAIAFFVVVIVSALVYAVSFVLIRALSRYRELAADRTGAMVTGAPSQLASALVKVSGEMARIPTRDLRAAEPFNAFFFVPALSSGFSLSTLFATHPPLEVRLDRLGQLSAQLGGPA
ncbi:MAG TPA: zinc metalloprotease HtpX [Actinomycetes bacterium]|nr:zinc metalloprotease HtpX [Actinomycetes bacterium]